MHGGGFYRVDKYPVAPPSLPEHLTWFRWEAYLTWVTGFALLVVQFYFDAPTWLIDRCGDAARLVAGDCHLGCESRGGLGRL